MDPSHETKSSVDQARREMLVAMTTWLIMLCISVGTCVTWGYGRTAESLKYYFGFPDWVFFSIIIPWAVSTLFSIWFALWFMQDNPEEEAESERQLEAGE